jgi:hypothetical protein
MPIFPTDLARQDRATAWAHHRWPEFRDWPEKDRTLVLCPVVGHTDWGLGHALDAEEQLVSALLQSASERKPEDLPWLVLPPCRFVAGPHPRTAFPVPLKLAYAQLADWARSVAASGFTRLVFVNASPFNEDIVDASGRDLRIELGLQCFVVNLSGLGLHLHPSAPDERQRAQTILTTLTGREPIIPPESDFPKTLATGLVSPWDPQSWPFPEPLSLSKAREEGKTLLEAAADHFIRLATEIRDRPPLDPRTPSITPASPARG